MDEYEYFVQFVNVPEFLKTLQRAKHNKRQLCTKLVGVFFINELVVLSQD